MSEAERRTIDASDSFDAPSDTMASGTYVCPRERSNFHRSCRWFQCRDLPAFTSREAMESHVKAAHSSMACNCGGVADYIGDGSVPDASRWRCAKCGSTFKTGPSRYSMGVLA